MTDVDWSEAPPRAELVARVRDALAELGTSLRILATDVLGADARIDLVAADPDGRVTLVLVTAAGDDLAGVALALAQRAWVEARLPDWAQLAPQLGLRSEAPLRVVLVGPAFSPTAIAAARAADAEDIDLVRFLCVRGAGNGRDVRVLLEPVRLAGATHAAPAPRRTGAPPPTVRFRSGLSDADLDLTPEERRGLD
ncbi:MAG: hypothetical protein JRH10_02805 [Deltaproteobacteria bacterium]|nr:hypothetical protein [Deltaproteobacteria bacterium]MBW2445718.1 hypothetical protein [Deltaproteobacteria bacterium]